MTAVDPWAATPVLRGGHVVLEPLASAHAHELADAVQGWDTSALWFTTVPAGDAMQAYVDHAIGRAATGVERPWLVRDAAGAAVGTTRFYDIDRSVPRVGIGYTWYVPRVQRTGLNTEAKALLLGHAFDALGCASVVLETSWFNHASRAAIARLGAKQDGVLRHHMRHADGTLRDSVVFSILDHEWPAVRGHLGRRLARGDGL